MDVEDALKLLSKRFRNPRVGHTCTACARLLSAIVPVYLRSACYQQLSQNPFFHVPLSRYPLRLLLAVPRLYCWLCPVFTAGCAPFLLLAVPRFYSMKVRDYAIRILGKAEKDELLCFLPQLVQVFRLRLCWP